MAAYESHGETDEWYTPRYIFDAIGLRFDLDVAAPMHGPRHVPAENHYHPACDGLTMPWFGLVWMNPPFGHQRHKRAWLERFFQHGNGIALVPDRTSAPWFQEYAPLADAICWVAPKIKFERPDGSVGPSPGTGTALLAAGQLAAAALDNCGLGMVTGARRPAPNTISTTRKGETPRSGQRGASLAAGSKDGGANAGTGIPRGGTICQAQSERSKRGVREKGHTFP